mmetsp:Transcript_3312/g.8239  ORF Transcript_3312/g.8239 Transcript_3312/m.8239 type:complete len:726 (+) Transcript_3312:2193-4370(+)
MEFCALQSKSDMVRFMLCAGAFEGAGKEECINGKCQVCGFKMLWSSGLRPHVLDKNGNICSRAPLEFQTTVKWVRIRSSKQETPGEASKTAYEQRQGTIVQFLDEFESESSRKFPHHRFTVQRQKQTDTQFQRERWPGWLQFDIDFAMDGTIPPPEGRSMQSDHWTPMSYTLFINIASWLDTDKWTSRTSRLTKGSAVTVEPSESSVAGATTPPTGSFWAEVVTVPSNVGSNCAESADQNVDHSVLLYGVRRHGAPKDAPPQLIERRYLRDRVMKTKAFIHVSDDKTHDSNAAQKFLNQTFESLDEHYVAAGKEKFVALRMHSDNAPSHFKNSKMMHFLTTLQERLKNSWAPGHNIFRVVWDFGPPGHGKGVWDGIGAWMKRTVRQDVVDHRPPSMPTILTSNGVILSPKQVAEHLQARFETADYLATHLDKTINEVVVKFTPSQEIIRQLPDYTYDTLPGIKKTFQFMPVREDVTLMRSFACWCTKCMLSWAPGEGSMNSNYQCEDCESPSLNWKEASIGRADAAGISNARQRSLNKARSLTKQLQAHFQKSTKPLWVAVQNRGEHDEDQYWIGRATGIEKVHDKASSVGGSVGRVRYDAGDCEIAVQWFERDECGGDERRIFKAEKHANGQLKLGTFNSTELRLISLSDNVSAPAAIHLEMQPLEPVGGVPLNIVRASPRLSNVPRPNYRVAHHVCTTRADPPNQLWEIISVGSERAILDNCF